MLKSLLLVTGSVSVLSAAALATRDLAAGDCHTSLLSIKVGAQNQRFNGISTPKSQLDVASIGIDQNRQRSNFTTNHLIQGAAGKQSVNDTFKISTTYCTPKGWNGQTVEILVHGIGPDHRYWANPSNPSSSYIDQALNAGYAVVAFDRLGTGESDHPDGFDIVQSPTDVQVLRGIIETVKKDRAFGKAKTFVGVGHSYGSIQLTAVAIQYPTLLDKLVLTGFSTDTTSSLPLFNFAFGSTIASMVDPVRFAKYANDHSYWVSAAPANDLEAFFNPGYYTTADFDYFESIKQPYTLGESLTMMSVLQQLPANKFEGEVIIVTGKNDLPFCGGDCYQKPKMTSGSSLLDDARVAAFPSASKFSTYIPPNTGHGVNNHVTTPQTFAVINRWLNGTYN